MKSRNGSAGQAGNRAKPPDAGGPLLALGRTQAQAGKSAEAAATFREFLKRKPQHAEGWFELGRVLLKAGKWHDAVAAFRSAGSLQPQNADALYLMGSALFEAARSAEAEMALSDAIALRPRFPEALVLLGRVHERLMKPEAAAAAHRQAIECAPHFAEAHFQFARMLVALGRSGEAIAAYEEAIRNAPNYTDAHNNLGMILKTQGRRDEAVAAFRRAIAVSPTYHLALCNLGNALWDSGQLDEAVDAYRSCIATNPQYVPPYVNISDIRRKQGKLKEAADFALRAVAVDKADAGAHSALGYVRQQQTDFENAIVALKRAMELAPRDPVRLYDLATAYRDNGQLDEAISLFRRALDLEPRYPAALNNLGLALQETGDFDGAKLAFRNAIEQAPNLGGAHGNLAQLVKFQEPDEHVRAMEALLVRPNLPPEQLVSLLFGLAKAYDDLKDYSRSFEYLHKGNRLKRSLLDIDLQGDFDTHEKMIESLTPSFFDVDESVGDPSRAPIFVVGMARSGTSLVEQILASHSQVHGAGELIYLQRIFAEWMQKIRQGSFSRRASGISLEELRTLGARYLTALRRQSTSAVFITDKMPFNFRFVGFLRLILPHAKIVHCKRDPLDICISSYKRLFTNGVFYSYDLKELGLYYNSYLSLVAHWRTVLPGSMFEIQYEDLVANQEERTRQLLDYCGLPWEDGCLNFHENERVVRTASLAQVRQPIYKTSVASSRKYYPYIRPLLETLGIDADEPSPAR